jgi:large subunit ribosomal protein L35
MPKMKTKSAAKKRFRLTGTGKVVMNHAYKRHGLVKRPQKMKRTNRGTRILNESDSGLVLHHMPYARA